MGAERGRLRDRRAPRGAGRLALAEQRAPRSGSSSPADHERKDQQGNRRERRAASSEGIQELATASRTAGQGSAGIRASTVYSFLNLRAPRLAAIVLSIAPGVTGVDGAKVSTARPPPASTRSMPSARAATRSPTTSSSPSTAGGGGP